MRSFRLTTLVVFVAAVGMVLGGCLPFRLPVEAVPSPDEPVSSATSPSSAITTPGPSRTPTPTPVPLVASDPFAGERVDLVLGYAAPQKTTMPCGSGGSKTIVARAGSYVGFANQEVAGVFDLASRQWLWCAATGFGGADGVVEVTTDSSVGRPGYLPSLDEDTLEASEYDPSGSAFFLRAGDETSLVVPVTIDRPQIGSQKEAPLRGLVAFDGHGVKTWIAGLPQTGDPQVSCRQDVTACLVQQGSGLKAVIVMPDPQSGQLSTLAEGGQLHKDADPGPVGSEVFIFLSGNSQATWARYENEADWHVLAVGGKAVGSYWYVGTIDHWVIVGDQSESKDRIRRIDTTTGADDIVEFGYPKQSCLPLADRRLLCTYYSSNPSIGVFDLATGQIVWEWKEDDPDPVTGVPRKVPRDLYVYGDLIFAGPTSSSERYLIDAETGADVPFDSKMTIAYELLRSNNCSSYGCVSVSGNSVEYTSVK